MTPPIVDPGTYLHVAEDGFEAIVGCVGADVAAAEAAGQFGRRRGDEATVTLTQWDPDGNERKISCDKVEPGFYKPQVRRTVP